LRQARDWTNTEQRQRFVGWLRKGYRAAIRRWQPYQQFKLLETFVAIERAVDRALISGEEYEGLDCVLHFSVQHETATIDIPEEL